MYLYSALMVLMASRKLSELLSHLLKYKFSDILDAINMKDFKDAPYSLAAINAYFHLKNMEVARVVTALECIRYGYKPEAISQYINQKRGVL